MIKLWIIFFGVLGKYCRNVQHFPPKNHKTCTKIVFIIKKKKKKISMAFISAILDLDFFFLFYLLVKTILFFPTSIQAKHLRGARVRSFWVNWIEVYVVCMCMSVLVNLSVCQNDLYECVNIVMLNWKQRIQVCYYFFFISTDNITTFEQSPDLNQGLFNNNSFFYTIVVVVV